MENRPKKPSTYDMLKRLDKKVQQKKNPRRDDYYSRNSSDSRKRRSSSPKSPDRYRKSFKKIPEVVIDDTDYDTPDRSFGDLYCKACDSHMNSDQMWEAHIQGKRHQKNTKKGEQGELKYEILDEKPLLLPEIKNSTEPIIGLQHCCEIRRHEGKPIYQCFLCSANVPNGQSLIEHVIGLKHRMAYLKEHDPVKHDLIDKTNLKKGMIEPVVAECIRLHQDKHGTGIMQVKLDKSKPSAPSNQTYKKPYQDVFDNVKRDDRRNNYHDERDEDYRFPPNNQQDFQRSRFSDDPYRERYSYSPDRDHRYPSASHYHRGESPPSERRSPIRYEHRHGAAAPNHPSFTSSMATSSTQNDDLHHALEQRRMQDKTSSNPNLFQSLVKIIETMPTMMFLELVLHRVEDMDPTETELTMLQKIGNHMISIVMNRKLQKLSPDLLGKYQKNPKEESSLMAEQSKKSTNNLNSLMNLVSQFNSTQTSSYDWGDSQSSPAFMTQSTGSFYSSSNTEIPGLTLTGSNEPQELYKAGPSWSDPSLRNAAFDRF